MTIAPLAANQEYLVIGDEKLLLRRVRGHEEYQQCEKLQRTVWGEQDIASVPLLALVTAQENGGFVLGAFTDTEELVGFVFSFPGVTDAGEVKQCSVLAAVSPAYQRLGVGYGLKLFQARLAAQDGFHLVTWTFDPLSGPNTVFNLNKLGAIGEQYLVNAYGVGRGLNAGLETDRLLVAWRVPAVPRSPVRDGAGTPVNGVRVDRRGLPRPSWSIMDCTDETVLITVPWDIYALSNADRELAVAWRITSRELLGGYLAEGYRAVGLRNPGAGRPPTYVLCKDLS